MSTTGLPALDSAVQSIHLWLDDIMRPLGWEDREKAYRALRVVLHELRDWLSVDDAAHLAAQLPLIVRGLFFEGWHPAGKPWKHHAEEFLARVNEPFSFDSAIRRDEIARAVLATVAKHVTAGEFEKIKHRLPADLRPLFP